MQARGIFLLYSERNSIAGKRNIPIVREIQLQASKRNIPIVRGIYLQARGIFLSKEGFPCRQMEYSYRKRDLLAGKRNIPIVRGIYVQARGIFL